MAQYRSFTYADTDAGGADDSPVAGLPTGAVEGDQLVAVLQRDQTGIAAVPDDWSHVATLPPGSQGDNTDIYQYDVPASPPSTFTWTLNTTDEWQLAIVCVEDGDTITQFDTDTSSTTVNDIDTPPVTPAADNACVITGVAYDTSSPGRTHGTDDAVTWTEILDEVETGVNETMALYYSDQTTATQAAHNISMDSGNADQMSAFTIVVPAVDSTPRSMHDAAVTAATTMKVRSRLVNTTSAVLHYGTDPGLVGASTTSADTPDGNGHVSFDVTGLSAATRYYYGVKCDSETIADIGTVKTKPSPGATASFTGGHASCLNSGNSTDAINVLTEILDVRDPDFFIFQGDFEYSDAQNDADMRTGYNNQFATAAVESFWRNMSIHQQWDDHDFGGNNSNGGFSAKTTRASVFDDYFPMVSAPLSNIKYRVVQAGRVDMFLLDERYDSSDHTITDDASKTMLGSTQKTQFKSDVDASTAELLIIFHGRPWHSSDVTADDWGRFTTEREELADHLQAAGIPVIHICGDMHGLAAADDTATGFDYTTTTDTVTELVLQAAAIDQTGSLKGGPYRLAQTTTTDQVVQGGGHYGEFTITDAGPGGNLVFSWTGRESTSTSASTVEVPTDASPVEVTIATEAPPAADVNWIPRTGPPRGMWVS